MKFKFYIFFFLFLFLIGSVSSTTLSMSPPQIDFVGKTGETLCQKVNIRVDSEEALIGKINWAKEGYLERKLSGHQLTDEEVGIETKFPELIRIENSTKVEICITGKNAGTYHGAILYRIKNKPVQVGIWMEVVLRENNLISITGNAIKDISVDEKNIGIYFTMGLVLILCGLWVLSKKKK